MRGGVGAETASPIRPPAPVYWRRSTTCWGGPGSEQGGRVRGVVAREYLGREYGGASQAGAPQAFHSRQGWSRRAHTMPLARPPATSLTTALAANRQLSDFEAD